MFLVWFLLGDEHESFGVMSRKDGETMRKLNKEAVDLQVESSYVEDGTLYVLVSQPVAPYPSCGVIARHVTYANK